ncbi:hypothetical protein [Anaeromicropila populeti]|uniref:Uncharacterized protein n=1 Tax=Anaeromicropila populeti TaxID=37658 RepID=A0A1I6JES6_9FIRM|nr:hypothetical protein [Anaeromicropila populeti]SFR77364.1 hypothetical protein SAMN05661086_01615 [Anaeromicropila populeti]
MAYQKDFVLESKDNGKSGIIKLEEVRSQKEQTQQRLQAYSNLKKK